ncbi:MAG TPA: histidine kinase [Bacteroidia bacterium]|nr:histidine kinase [Bacteroidia bacterium]
MKLSARHILIHIAGWLFFVLITILILNDPEQGVFSLFQNTGIMLMLTASVSLMMSFFYLNRKFLIPEYFFQRKYFVYAIIVTLFVSLLLLMPFLMRLGFDSGFDKPGPQLLNHLLSTLLLFMMVFIVSTAGPVLKRWIDAENSAVELENQRLSAELSFLKSQVNPHFLFNTLNNIYALSVNSDPVASESILKLSQLLRYILQEAQSENVSINKEIEHLKQYIDLQKLRFTKKVNVNFEVTTDASGFSIAPLLLLPFVENAFKYGISAHEASKIDIMLSFKGSIFEFSVKNTLNNGSIAEIESTGIGVENVRKRLELSYPGNFDLIIKNNTIAHSVYLKITGLC